MNNRVQRLHHLAVLYQLLPCLVLLALLCPDQALSEKRYWSSRRGLAGVRLGRSTPSLSTAKSVQQQNDETDSAQSRNSRTSNSDSNLQDNENDSSTRGALRYDWSSGKDSIEQTPEKNEAHYSKTTTRGTSNVNGVRIELLIDYETDSRLQMLSLQTGIPYRELVYRFFRMGEKSFYKSYAWGPTRYGRRP